MIRAIERLLTGPRDPDTVGRFLVDHSFPIVEGTQVTFVWRGAADAVRLRHWIFGLPTSQALTRMDGSDLWHFTMTIPPASRVEYKFEVEKHGRSEWLRDPLNPRLARDPFGANSVVVGVGYEEPEWAKVYDGVPQGTLDRLQVHSDHVGLRSTLVYKPHRYRPTRTYPLLVVHDGDDYLRYASLGAVLDNLMARREIPDMVVALTSSHRRLDEYANDEAHQRYVTEELVPAIEERWTCGGRPQLRGLMGASFGGVASLSTAVRYPGFYGRLLLQSGSFAFTDIGERNHRGPVFDPVVRFMNAFRADPAPVSERVFVSCGTYESLIYENRSLIPVLEDTGMMVSFREARDGHNWENWRDRLREGLSWLFPGPFLLTYE